MEILGKNYEKNFDRPKNSASYESNFTDDCLATVFFSRKEHQQLVSNADDFHPDRKFSSEMGKIIRHRS